MMLGTRMSGNAGYPLGGAYQVMERIENKYRNLGGRLHFNSRVNEILVENGKAAGIKVNGVSVCADAVIAACDMYDTLYNMLGGKYKHEQLNAMLKSAPLFDPIAVVSFGVKRRFGLPFSVTYECPEGIETAPGMVLNRFNLHAFDFDPSAAPENCSSVMVLLTSELDYWQKLRRENMAEYKAKKQSLADQVAKAIEKRIPGFQEAIDVVDVATPATYVRYANLYRGSWEGFAPTPSAIKTNIRTTVDGVKGLYLCGQWTTAGGGICTAVKSGKDAAKAAMRRI
jgi:phytoene dehydrogenase-like protein